MSETMSDWGDDTGVGRAADWLDITEFELFCKAYESWFSYAGSEHRIEKYFVKYMFYGEVPFWVRHFVRSTVSEPRVEGAGDRGEVAGLDHLYARFWAFVVSLVARDQPSRGDA